MADNKKDDENMITLEFDDGTTVECEIIGVFDADDKEYIALVPDDGSDDYYIYRYKEVSEEDYDLLDIEDDKEFEKAVKEFEKLID